MATFHRKTPPLLIVREMQISTRRKCPPQPARINDQCLYIQRKLPDLKDTATPPKCSAAIRKCPPADEINIKDEVVHIYNVSGSI